MFGTMTDRSLFFIVLLSLFQHRRHRTRPLNLESDSPCNRIQLPRPTMIPKPVVANILICTLRVRAAKLFWSGKQGDARLAFRCVSSMMLIL
jgi:hypothetical protein